MQDLMVTTMRALGHESSLPLRVTRALQILYTTKIVPFIQHAYHVHA